MSKKPWHGIITATALPFKSGTLEVDYEKFAEHIKWLAANNTQGVVVNGSLGEYQVLTAEERAKVVEVAVATAPPGFSVLVGVGAYGADESRRWTEQAKSAGATSVMCLPPTSYRANDDEVVVHYKEVAKGGLPIIAYNNPFDTKVDLTPELFARVANEVPEVVAIKEFSGDVRRVWQIHSLAPRIDVLVGADDVLLELATAGISGWIAGFPNALPRESAQIYELAIAGKFVEARDGYAALHDIFHWDSKKEFIQAIKLTMDLLGRYGGPTRLPRLPLPASDAARVKKDLDRVKAYFKI